MRLLMLALLVALTVFSAGSCATAPAKPPEAVSPILERPTKPELEQPVFVDKEGGLWLSYADYRALERNIIAMREYAAKLEALLDYYAPVPPPKR